jgi:hypothetical protein
MLPASAKRTDNGMATDLITPDEWRRRELDAWTEAAFQEWLRKRATEYGWMFYHTWNSRKSAPGFPDAIIVRPPDVDYEWRPLIVAELKRQNASRPSGHQVRWLDAFRATAAALGATDDIIVRLWRPADQPAITALLLGARDWETMN